MDNNNSIIILDSDDEADIEVKPTSKTIIYIDLSDDEASVNAIPTKDPLTEELEFILQAPLSQEALSNINKKALKKPLPSRPISLTQQDRSSCDTSSQRRKKSVNPSFNQRPELKKQRIEDPIHRQELENELERFVSAVTSTRYQPIDTRIVSCPICHVDISVPQLNSHISVCRTVKVSKKKTIAEAVAMDESERKRRNLGKEEIEPTNYYKISDEVFGNDGNGFNEAASAAQWEYAGQTHFG